MMARERAQCRIDPPGMPRFRAMKGQDNMGPLPKPRHHVLVCTNVRPADNPKGSCGPKGADAIVDALKDMTRDRGLKDSVIVNRTSCLKHCSRGVTVAIQPDNVWYANVDARGPRGDLLLPSREGPVRSSASRCPTSPGSDAGSISCAAPGGAPPGGLARQSSRKKSATSISPSRRNWPTSRANSTTTSLRLEADRGPPCGCGAGRPR